jgi:hypothetical protein
LPAPAHPQQRPQQEKSEKAERHLDQLLPMWIARGALPFLLLLCGEAAAFVLPARLPRPMPRPTRTIVYLQALDIPPPAPAVNDDSVSRIFLQQQESQSEGECVRSPVVSVVNDESFQRDVLTAAAAGDGSLTIIKYYSPTCRSCRAIRAPFERLALEHPESRFFEVSYQGTTARLCQAQGVRKLPTIAVFAGGERVWQETVGKRKWPAFLEALQKDFGMRTKGMECEPEDPEGAEDAEEISD